MNLNKVLLAGNCTRDPQLRYLPNQTPIVEFGVAVNRKWKTPQGEDKEETTFVDLSAWGKAAEVLNQYMRKGKPIFVEGRHSPQGLDAHAATERIAQEIEWAIRHRPYQWFCFKQLWT